MLLDPDQCQLVLVDYQVKLMPAIHDHERVIRKARLLAQMAHLMDIPVWATTQRADALGLKTGERVTAIDGFVQKWSQILL